MVEYKPCEISCYNIYTVYQNLWRAGEYCRLSVLILEFMPKGQKIIKKTHFLPNNVILIFNNTVYGNLKVRKETSISDEKPPLFICRLQILQNIIISNQFLIRKGETRCN